MSTLDSAGSVYIGLSTILEASTDSTMQSRFATTVTPESRATTASIPVPTRGAWVRRRGTAWRIIFEPISARFASSFSKKGISDAATDTNWFGETSIMSTASGSTISNSPCLRAETRSSLNRPSSSRGAFACAMDILSSSSAERKLTSPSTLPPSTFL